MTTTLIILFLISIISVALKKTQEFSVGRYEVKIHPVKVRLSKHFIKGFDASAVNDVWNKNKYCDDDGSKKDVFEVLKNHGVNWVRLRVWNNPLNPDLPENPGSSDLENLLDEAQRAKEFGLKILLDFHYSDYWADPGKQSVPEDWLDTENSDQMADYVAEWTTKVLLAMKEEDCAPDMIQIGNEINSGILTGFYKGGKIQKLSSTISGSSTLAPANFTKYLAAGLNAARTACPDAKLMLHAAEGGGNIFWLLDMFKAAKLDYDVAGLSYYPFEKSHGTLTALSSNIKKIRKQYKKQVVIAETAHPFAAENQKCAELVNATANLIWKNGRLYSHVASRGGTVTASVQNQADVIHAVIEVSAKAGALGFFTWGGEYPGSWKYGMFTDKGIPLPSLYIFLIK